MSTRTKPRGQRWLLPAIVVAAILAACDAGSDTSTGPSDTPQPGVLEVHVAGGETPAYGFLIEITGPGITAVQPVAAGQTYTSFSSTGVAVAVVRSSLGDGPIFGIEVPDVNRDASYSVVVRQATDSRNEPLEPSSYRASLER